jgi:hypothetical protein
VGGKSIPNFDLKEIPPEEISTSLNQKEGLWNRLTSEVKVISLLKKKKQPFLLNSHEN